MAESPMLFILSCGNWLQSICAVCAMRVRIPLKSGQDSKTAISHAAAAGVHRGRVLLLKRKISLNDCSRQKAPPVRGPAAYSQASDTL